MRTDEGDYPVPSLGTVGDYYASKGYQVVKGLDGCHYIKGPDGLSYSTSADLTSVEEQTKENYKKTIDDNEDLLVLAIAGRDNGLGINKSTYGLKLIDGKVGGKIPLDEFNSIRNQSIHNADAKSMTLGKYSNGSDSYISVAGKESTYFDLGENWGKIQNKYELINQEMFDYFNKPAIDDAVKAGKAIRFSHKPDLEIYKEIYLAEEWKYLKNKYGYSILFEGEGGIWYAK